jgi:hypothetical protein
MTAVASARRVEQDARSRTRVRRQAAQRTRRGRTTRADRPTAGPGAGVPTPRAADGRRTAGTPAPRWPGRRRPGGRPAPASLSWAPRTHVSVAYHIAGRSRVNWCCRPAPSTVHMRQSIPLARRQDERKPTGRHARHTTRRSRCRRARSFHPARRRREADQTIGAKKNVSRRTKRKSLGRSSKKSANRKETSRPPVSTPVNVP